MPQNYTNYKLKMFGIVCLKIFFFQNQNAVRADLFPGSLAVQWCGFAAPNFSRGFSPPVGAAANVRAISSVDHTREKDKPEATASLRSAAIRHWIFGLISTRRFYFWKKKIFRHSIFTNLTIQI